MVKRIRLPGIVSARNDVARCIGDTCAAFQVKAQGAVAAQAVERYGIGGSGAAYAQN